MRRRGEGEGASKKNRASTRGEQKKKMFKKRKTKGTSKNKY